MTPGKSTQDMRHRQRKMLLLLVVCNLLPLGFALEEAGDLCPLDSCCNTTWDGQPLAYCRSHTGSISFPETSPPKILNIPNTRPVTPKQILQSSGTFTLRVLNINVWGLKFESETVAVRMEAIKTLLKNSLYDLVLVQEAWYNEDYR